jgi:SAM-dependent methyltransferase
MEQVVEKPEVVIEIKPEAFALEPDITWTHKGLPHILASIPVGMKSLVDVGCGRGIIAALARIYRSPTKVVGVDVFRPYLEFCGEMGLYDSLHQMDLREASLPFYDKEFDVATCVEVIEHLPEDKGLHLIEELERIAETVIITTPNVLFSQDMLDGNSFQRHVSSWSVADFLTRGYRVHGIGDFIFLGRHVKYLSFLLSRFSYKMPQLSETLLAFKTSK